jgi:hypothetical protein
MMQISITVLFFTSFWALIALGWCWSLHGRVNRLEQGYALRNRRR